jgi:Spy/CpxP family protein refolding chaperone
MKRVLAVLLMVALVTAAFGQQPGMGEGRGPGPQAGERPMDMHKGIMAKLNLNEDQQAQMEKMHLDLQKKQVALRSKIEIAHLEVKELFGATSPDKGAIEKKMKEVSELQLQQKINGLDHLFAVKAILTPEQQKIWKEHMKQAGPEMREGMRGMRRGGGR